MSAGHRNTHNFYHILSFFLYCKKNKTKKKTQQMIKLISSDTNTVQVVASCRYAAFFS